MKTNYIIILFLIAILFSCKSIREDSSAEQSGLVLITKAQFNSEKMELGEPMRNPFQELVHFTGAILPTLKGRAQISLPLPGSISKIYCNPAQNVSKNASLFEVSGNDFIDIQKDFAESAAVLKRLRSEFEIARELYDENIIPHKEYTVAESAYYVEQAKYNALKIKLENMGLDVSLIEKGIFFSSYTIKSPINGYVSSIDAIIGQYIDPQQKIAEIIDAGSYQLRLSVFVKDIKKVRVGQTVTFFLNSDRSESYFAKLASVGKILMNETKSIDCYAEIEDSMKMSLVSYQYAEGEIILAVDSVFSLPQTAIIQVGNESFVLMLEKSDDDSYYFNKTRVVIGRKNSFFVELMEIPPSKKILINGIYNISID